MDKYAHLEQACAGAINPETLENFRRAIPEFHRFMQEAREFFAPRRTGIRNEDLGENNGGAPAEE